MKLKKLVLNITKAAFKGFGLEVFPKRRGYAYQLQSETPAFFGKSAHKLMDIRLLPVFGPLADTVIQHNRTYLYYDRLFTLFHMIRNLTQNIQPDEKVNFAEVGVHRGGGSYFIASSAKALGLKNMSLHSFDTFEGHAEEDIHPDLDSAHKPGSFGNVDFDDVKKYLSAFDNIKAHKGRFQETSAQVSNEKFHFVHLDVDIYEPTAFGLEFFDRHLVKRGIIVVDDYGFASCPGAKKAIDEFIETHTEYFSFPLLTGQFLLIKY